MASRSSLRLRRLSDRATIVQKQLIKFQIRQTGFLLPIESVYRAVVFNRSEIRRQEVMFEGQSLRLVEVDRHILGHATAQPSVIPQIISLIVQTSGEFGQRFVLPIDSAPSLCRVPETSLVPLPKTYRVQCVESITDSSADDRLCFLLNPDQLAAAIMDAKVLALS